MYLFAISLVNYLFQLFNHKMDFFFFMSMWILNIDIRSIP